MLMEVYDKLVKCDECLPVAANEVSLPPSMLNRTYHDAPIMTVASCHSAICYTVLNPVFLSIQLQLSFDLCKGPGGRFCMNKVQGPHALLGVPISLQASWRCCVMAADLLRRCM